MNPWDIIGWIALVSIVTVGALVVWHFAIPLAVRSVWKRWLHIKSRDITPVPGQVWMQGDTQLTIVPNISKNGRIVMTTQLVVDGRRYGNGASWSDSPDEWAERVKSRRLWLLKDAAP